MSELPRYALYVCVLFVVFARSCEPAVLMAAAEIYVGGKKDQTERREQALRRDHFQLFLRFQGAWTVR